MKTMKQIKAEAEEAAAAAKAPVPKKTVSFAPPPAPSTTTDTSQDPAGPYTPPLFDYTAAVANPEAELASRELCRRRLLPFIQRFRPKYTAGWVHADICRRFERFLRQVEAGEEPRLLLMMPPRSGKSEISSRHYAAWVLGQHPDWEIIAASHTSSLTMTFSRYLRDLMNDPAYHAIFPDAVLDPNSRAVENWNLTKGGGYLAAGVGTGITGRGAHILLLDDLVKDIEAADSLNQRDNTWEWYISTAYTRLAPGGGVLGLMTWWHDDDWAGRIQQAMDAGEGDKFEIVRYPAINDIGDEYILLDDTIRQCPPNTPVPQGARLTRPMGTAIHPERYTTEAMLRIKRNAIAGGMKRTWDALYQQNPIPDEGNYFSKDMFRFYSTPPPRGDMYVYQAWDFAISEGKESDYTVGVTIGVDHRDAAYVLDVKRFKSSDGILIANELVNYAIEWNVDGLGFEDGQIWKAIETMFMKSCEEKRAYPAYEVLKPLTDKMVRASPLRGRMQAGKVYFDDKAHWFRDVQKEMLHFPAGKHDDCHTFDTLVECQHGQVKMGLLKDGDKVLSYDGIGIVIGEVRGHHCTGVKEVLKLTLADGTVIELTPVHPVLTARGYVYAGDLTSTDEIVRKSLCAYRDSGLTGQKSPMATTSQRPSLTEHVSGYIAMLTKQSAGLFQKVGTFITSTGIRTTTTLKTLNACQGAITTMSIVRNGLNTAKAKLSLPILPTSGSLRSRRKQGAMSVRESCEKVSSEPLHASIAAPPSPSRGQTPTTLAIALQCAGRNFATSMLQGVNRFARSVVWLSCLPTPQWGTRCFAQLHAGTNSGTRINTSHASAKVAKAATSLPKATLHPSVRPVSKAGVTSTRTSAPPVGKRFYPASRMAAYSAVETVLTSTEDLAVTRNASQDSNRQFVRVVSIQQAGYQATYNFEVDGTRNYLVHGGVVVHNCIDAMSWCIRMILTRMAPRQAVGKKLPSWKDGFMREARGESHMAA